MKVTVYTNPNCVACDQTKRYLDRVGIPYEVVDLATNPEAAEMVIAKGHKQAPVVITDKNEWSGFKLAQLSDLSHRFTAEG